MRWLMIALVWIPTLASAQDGEPTSNTPYKQARIHFEAGEFEQATILLKQVYEQEPAPVLLYNIARAYEVWEGHSSEALEYYTRFLKEDPNSPNRRAVEGRIAAIGKEMNAEEERQRLEEEKAAAQTAAKDEERRRRLAEVNPSPLPWIGFGLGVVVAGTGVVLGALARKNETDALGAMTGVLTGQANQRAKTLALAANVSFAAGGVLALAGLIWGIIDLKRVKRVRASIGFGAASLSVSF